MSGPVFFSLPAWSGFSINESNAQFLVKDYAGFHMKCMEDGYTGGGFHLAPMVAVLTKSHKKTTRGKAFCHGMNNTFGHASLAYEVKIQYHKWVNKNLQALRNKALTTRC